MSTAISIWEREMLMATWINMRYRCDKNDETDHLPTTPPFDVANCEASCRSKEEERKHQQGSGNTWGDRDRACRSFTQTLLWAGLLTTHPYTRWRPQSRGRASSVTTQGPHRLLGPHILLSFLPIESLVLSLTFSAR